MNLNESSLNESLLHAVYAGQYDKVFECLQKGAKANAITISCSRTAIGTAALVGNAEILELLIQSCEDSNLFKRNIVDSHLNDMNAQMTPEGMEDLQWENEFFEGNCVSEENDEIGETASGGSIYYYYAKTFESTGAIISGINNGYGDDYAMLQDPKFDPNEPDGIQMTPLHYAAEYGRINCMCILLDHGATVYAVDTEGYTPLHAGARYAESTKLLLKHGANLNSKTLDRGETPLHISIRNYCSAGARAIIEAGANINEVDNNVQTPLMYAIINKLDEIALLLIDKGASVNVVDVNGYNALYYSVINNNIVVAERLLRADARIITSHYLLHICTRNNKFRMLKLLVDYGACINIFEPVQQTPVYVAIKYKRVDILDYLFEKLGGNNYRPEYYAEFLFAVRSVMSLQEFKMIARIFFAHMREHCFLVKNVFLPSKDSCNCITPLSRAIMIGKLDIAEYLLKEGIGIEHICHDHMPNFLRSASNIPGKLEFTKLLINVGYKFPCVRPPYPDFWSAERQKFENEIYELRDNPLSLQALCRIRIRKQLMRTLIVSEAAQKKYFRSHSKCTPLALMLDDLKIPQILKTFLYDYDDCYPIKNFYKGEDYPIFQLSKTINI